MINNNIQQIQKRQTPQQQQKKTYGIIKPVEETTGSNIRNIRITTQTLQKYIPSANKVSNPQRLNLGLGINKNLNLNRNKVSNQEATPNTNGILQAVNNGIDRQQTLIKQNNGIIKRNTIGPIQTNTQNMNNQQLLQQGGQKQDQKTPFIIKKTKSNTNKNIVVNTSSQNNSNKSTTQSNLDTPTVTQNARNSLNSANTNSNYYSIAGNPSRRLRETMTQNINNPVQNNTNGVNQNINNMISSQPIASSILASNTNQNVGLTSTPTNINSIRPNDTNWTNNNPNSQPLNNSSNYPNLTQLSQLMRNSNNMNNGSESRTSQQNTNNQLSNFTALQRSVLLSNTAQQSVQQDQQTNQISVTNIINIQSPSSNINSRNVLMNSIQQIQQNSSIARTQSPQSRQTPLLSIVNNSTINVRGDNEQRQQESNNVDIAPIRPRPLINQSSSNNIQEVTSQRQTQNSIQNVSQTGNRNVVENITRLNPTSPSNIQINRNESTLETIQRNLELLNQQRRQQEQQALQRQQIIDERVARARAHQANRYARQQMRMEYRENNGRDMSGSSSSVDEEEQKIENVSRQQRRDISLSSSDNEEERKEDRGRSNISSSIPPIRNSSNPSNVYQLNFRRQGGSNEQQQNPVSRIGIGFDTVINRRPINDSPRVGDTQASSNIRNVNNTNINSNEQEESRTFRIFLPLAQFANINGNTGNQRTVIEGMRNLLQSFMGERPGNVSGNFSLARLEELTQLVATLRLLQGLQFTGLQGLPLSPRLSNVDIQKFPVIQLKSVEQDDSCSICLEDWKVNDSAQILGCKHKFHPHCVEAWLKQKTICPYCKIDQREFLKNNTAENQL